MPHSQFHRIRLRGFTSVAEVITTFKSLIDIAYIDEVLDNEILVIADDRESLAKDEEYNWLCGLIRQELAAAGMHDIQFSWIPPCNNTVP
jgi:hypothetical protein